jgi:hypothetical protein
MVQLDPARRSAKGASPKEVPTLMQSLAVLHDTSITWVLAAPAGLGVDWIVHPVPSKTSAKVADRPGPPRE